MIAKIYKIIFFCFIIFYQNVSYSKNLDITNFNEENIYNYFSALVSLDNNQYSNSLKFFNSSKFLKESYQPYINKYLFSLILNGKITTAIKEIKTIENKKVFQYIDYLFISDEDVFMNIKELGKLIKGWVIMHHKGGSVCTDGDEIFETKVSVIENVNVLGTGDMFAASFMNGYLNFKNKKLKEIVVNSHKEVTNYLEELVYEKS